MQTAKLVHPHDFTKRSNSDIQPSPSKRINAAPAPSAIFYVTNSESLSPTESKIRYRIVKETVVISKTTVTHYREAMSKDLSTVIESKIVKKSESSHVRFNFLIILTFA